MERWPDRLLGATPDGEGRVRFRVWAPSRRRVEVALEAAGGVRHLPLTPSEGGYFEGVHPAEVGARYRYRLDGGESYPDPASRSQPSGPHGPSEIVDPHRFRWSDGEHHGPASIKGQILYELHVGLYTQEGTFRALARELPALKDLGVTLLELMPLNGFPGRFNWGYDGVNLFAPNATYGTPDELRALVNRAHELGLHVLLDVVYNHLGPDGNYLWQYSRNYFSDRHPKEWGEPPEFEGPDSGPVREFVVQNVRHWIREYHFDGLRVDATQCLYDESERHICAELTAAARLAAHGRSVLVIGESEPQSLEAVTRADYGGWGMDAIWADDFHHAARVALTGRREAYLQDYRGTAQELLSCALRNTLFQGQHYDWQAKPRGGFLMHEPPEKVLSYLETHDQLSNQLPSLRLSRLAGEALTRAITTLWLLMPQTPLLFMGQEFFSSAPFYYFCDHPPELQAAVKKGRTDYMKQFPSAKRMLEEEGYVIPDGEAAFLASKLELEERERNGRALCFHRELLGLRRGDPVFREQDPTALAGAVLSEHALALRFFGAEHGDRLLLLNLAGDLSFDPCPEPLLAPSPGTRWGLLFASEDSRFGGAGSCFPDGSSGFEIPGHRALVLRGAKGGLTSMYAEEPSLPLLTFEWTRGTRLEEAISREWLVTNGLGSYASGSVASINTRRYHGLFTPSLPTFGRTVMLARMAELVQLGGRQYRLDGEERADGTVEALALPHLRRFELRGTLPEWTYDLDGTVVTRSLVFTHLENTVFIRWRHQGSQPMKLHLRPFTTFRFHDKPIPPPGDLPTVVLQGERVEVKCAANAPPMRCRVVSDCQAPFVGLHQSSPPQYFRVERARGLDHEETQLSPGYFECTIDPGKTIYFGVTVEPWDVLDRDPAEAFELELRRQRRLVSHAPPVAQRGLGARLVLAADQFIIKPSARAQDQAWARATGQHARSVIAGYHWFTDWGRDTMISLEGLTLSTGRHQEAEAILRTFKHYVKDGLLPNLFPEGESEGLYHTADATLWFFHAVHRYVQATGDLSLLRDFFPKLAEIVDFHLRGTRYNIRIDPKDGLLTQGEEGYQLTWMDAKVEGWVVTPRRGKAVELNALWFNAVALMEQWAHTVGADPAKYAEAAARCRKSFNERFWNEEDGCLFDIVDKEGGGNDPAIRPNQIFAISLDNPVLDRARWEPVLKVVERDLLTPVGLRSLAPGHPDYRPNYDGDLRARDAAYHQGTVWSWLIGHYADALAKSGAEPRKVRAVLAGLEAHLREAGLGTVSEIFDATDPFRPRGCIAQAWGVAELLRSWSKLIGAKV